MTKRVVAMPPPKQPVRIELRLPAPFFARFMEYKRAREEKELMRYSMAGLICNCMHLQMAAAEEAEAEEATKEVRKPDLRSREPRFRAQPAAFGDDYLP